MQTKIQKWGNSLGLRIPRSCAIEANLEEGSTVEVSVKEDCLHVRAIRPGGYRLKDLLKGIRKENLHGEVSTGSSVGREEW